MRIYTVLIWVALGITLGGQAIAQNAPVQVVAQLRQPTPKLISEFISTDALSVYVLLKDPSFASLDVNLVWELSGPNGFTFRKPVPTGPTTPLRVTTAVNTFSGVSLNNFLELVSITPNANDLSGIQQAGRLPNGLYTLRIYAIDAAFGRPVSNVATVVFVLDINQPPLVNFPSGGKPVETVGPQNFTISWTPRSAQSLRNSIVYRLQLFEMNANFNDPNIAVLTNTPIFDLVTQRPNQTSYQYSPADPPLQVGRFYALRIQAIDVEGALVFENNGWSVVEMFQYLGCPAINPQNLRYAWQGEVLRVSLNQPNMMHRYYSFRIDDASLGLTPIAAQDNVPVPEAYFSQVYDYLRNVNFSPNQQLKISVTGYCQADYSSQPTELAFVPISGTCPPLSPVSGGQAIASQWMDKTLVLNVNKALEHLRYQVLVYDLSQPQNLLKQWNFDTPTMYIPDFYEPGMEGRSFVIQVKPVCLSATPNDGASVVIKVPQAFTPPPCPTPVLSNTVWNNKTASIRMVPDSKVIRYQLSFRVNDVPRTLTFENTAELLSDALYDISLEGQDLPVTIQATCLVPETYTYTIRVRTGGTWFRPIFSVVPQTGTRNVERQSLPLNSSVSVPFLQGLPACPPLVLKPGVAPVWVGTELNLPVVPDANHVGYAFRNVTLGFSENVNQAAIGDRYVPIRTLYERLTAPNTLILGEAICRNGQRSQVLNITIAKPTGPGAVCAAPVVVPSWVSTSTGTQLKVAISTSTAHLGYQVKVMYKKVIPNGQRIVSTTGGGFGSSPTTTVRFVDLVLDEVLIDRLFNIPNPRPLTLELSDFGTSQQVAAAYELTVTPICLSGRPGPAVTVQLANTAVCPPAEIASAGWLNGQYFLQFKNQSFFSGIDVVGDVYISGYTYTIINGMTLRSPIFARFQASYSMSASGAELSGLQGTPIEGVQNLRITPRYAFACQYTGSPLLLRVDFTGINNVACNAPVFKANDATEWQDGKLLVKIVPNATLRSIIISYTANGRNLSKTFAVQDRSAAFEVYTLNDALDLNMVNKPMTIRVVGVCLGQAQAQTGAIETTTIPKVPCATPELVGTPKWMGKTLYLTLKEKTGYQESFTATAVASVLSAYRETSISPEFNVRNLYDELLSKDVAFTRLRLTTTCASVSSQAIEIDVQRPSNVDETCQRPEVSFRWNADVLAVTIKQTPQQESLKLTYYSTTAQKEVSNVFRVNPVERFMNMDVRDFFNEEALDDPATMLVSAVCINKTESDAFQINTQFPATAACREPSFKNSIWAADSSLRLWINPSRFHQPTYTLKYQRPGLDNAVVTLTLDKPEVTLPKFFVPRLARQTIRFTVTATCTADGSQRSANIFLTAPAANTLSRDTIAAGNRITCRPDVTFECGNLQVVLNNSNPEPIARDSVKMGSVLAIGSLDMKITKLNPATASNSANNSYDGEGLIVLPKSFISPRLEVTVKFTDIKIGKGFCMTAGRIEGTQDAAINALLQNLRSRTP